MNVTDLKALVEINAINLDGSVRINDQGNGVEFLISEMHTFNVDARILPDGTIEETVEDDKDCVHIYTTEEYATFLRCAE